MEPRRRRPTLLALLALALSVQVLLVLCLADVFFYGEELEKGTAAKAMLDGLGVPHHQLAYHYYEGGGFVVSHLKALAFLAVGENLLANKLVALVFVLGVLAAGYAYLARSFGRAAAVWFALLYTFPAASFLKLRLVSLGIHFEATLFLLLAFLLTSRIAFERDLRLRTYFALGLVVGFGTYFSYQTPVVALWCALLLAWRLPVRTFGLGGLAGIGGTLLGLLPFLWMLYLVGDAMFDVHGTTRAGRPPSSVALRSFLLSVYADGSLGSRVGPLLWPMATLAGALAVLGDRRPERVAERRHFLFLALFIPLWIAVYLSTPFVQDDVPHFFYVLRLAPIWMVSLAVIAIALGQRFGPRARPGRGPALVAGAVLVAVGVWNTAQAVREGRPGELAACWDELVRQKGYDYEVYLTKLAGHLEGDEGQKLEVFLRFDEPDRESLASAASAALFFRARPDVATAFSQAQATIERAAPPELVESMVLGLGRLLVAGSRWDVARALEPLEALPEGRLREVLAEAVGRSGTGKSPFEGVLREYLEAVEGSPLAEPFARGLGHRLHRLHRLRPARAEAFIAQAGALGPALREGYQRARRSARLP